MIIYTIISSIVYPILLSEQHSYNACNHIFISRMVIESLEHIQSNRREEAPGWGIRLPFKIKFPKEFWVSWFIVLKNKAKLAILADGFTSS